MYLYRFQHHLRKTFRSTRNGEKRNFPSRKTKCEKRSPVASVLVVKNVPLVKRISPILELNHHTSLSDSHQNKQWRTFYVEPRRCYLVSRLIFIAITRSINYPLNVSDNWHPLFAVMIMLLSRGLLYWLVILSDSSTKIDCLSWKHYYLLFVTRPFNLEIYSKRFSLETPNYFSKSA